MSHLTYLEAMVVGLVQGVTELFPVSSLGHNVLIPALIGGSWARDLNVSKPESPYLAFIVGLHVATAVAMIAYFWRDWVRIIRGFLTSIAQRRVETPDQKLAWMIILATIPVGIAGLALEHLFRVAFSKPIPTAFFLAVNGLILLGGERLRRSRQLASAAASRQAPRAAGQTVTAGHVPAAPAVGARAFGPAALGGVAAGTGQAGVAGLRPATPAMTPALDLGSARRPAAGRGTAEGRSVAGGRHASGQRAVRQEELAAAVAADSRLSLMGYVQAVLIGSAQIVALLPGISRDGIVTVTGMFRGLSREDAVRYSFLLSAPVILAAGMLKVPDLMGPLGNGIHGQILAGSVLSGVGAYLSVRFLVRYFRQDRPLTPFAIYCLVAGLGSLVFLVLR